MTIHTIGTLEGWLAAAALGAADWVCLAPAPTFAIMALLTGVLDECLPFGTLAEADLQSANGAQRS